MQSSAVPQRRLDCFVALLLAMTAIVRSRRPGVETSDGLHRPNGRATLALPNDNTGRGCAQMRGFPEQQREGGDGNVTSRQRAAGDAEELRTRWRWNGRNLSPGFSLR